MVMSSTTNLPADPGYSTEFLNTIIANAVTHMHRIQKCLELGLHHRTESKSQSSSEYPRPPSPHFPFHLFRKSSSQVHLASVLVAVSNSHAFLAPGHYTHTYPRMSELNFTPATNTLAQIQLLT